MSMNRIMLLPIIAVCAMVAVAILNEPMHAEEVVETYFTSEQLSYQETFAREAQIWKFCCPLISRVTQVQYGIRNMDEVPGKFILNFAFDNGTNRENKTESRYLLAGEEKTVTVDSPLKGHSKVAVTVMPPAKIVAHERTEQRKVSTFSKLWELRKLRFLR